MLTGLRRLCRPLARLGRQALGIDGLGARLDALQQGVARVELGLAGARAAAEPVADGPVFATLSLPKGRDYVLSVDGASQADSYQRGIGLGYTADMSWRFLMAWLRPGDVFFDLGANVGVYSIPAAMLGARVHAFELLEANIRHFVRAVAQNNLPDVSVTLGAVWDRGGAVGFAGYSAWAFVQPGSPVSVASVVIDDYVAQRGIGRVDVAKIDVEGAERNALRGMTALIGRDHPDILIEGNALTCGVAGYSCRDMLGVLAGHGYALYRFHADRLCPWDAASVQEIVCTDYFATMRDADEIARRSGWAIGAMTPAEVIGSVLAQEALGEDHRLYVLAARERLAPEVVGDARVAAALRAWAELPQSGVMEMLRVGAG